MHLKRNVYANEACLELLISSCHVLEDLKIVRKVDDNVKVLRVHSQTLTSLSVGYEYTEYRNRLSYAKVNSGVFIDAPRLKYLKLKNELSVSKIISNLGSLVKIDFVGFFHKPSLSNKQMICNFFTGISSVRDMIISESTMEVCVYIYIYI